MALGDIVLRVEGKSTGVITGESVCAAHPGAIDVRDWSWSMTGPSSLAASGAASKVALGELRLTKYVDRASTALASVMRSNEQIKKAVITVRKAGGAAAIDFLTVTVERGRITAFDIGTAAPDSPDLVERISIAFEKIEIAYATQDAKGAKGAASTFMATTS